jgi:hypothetical protein
MKFELATNVVQPGALFMNHHTKLAAVALTAQSASLIKEAGGRTDAIRAFMTRALAGVKSKDHWQRFGMGLIDSPADFGRGVMSAVTGAPMAASAAKGLAGQIGTGTGLGTMFGGSLLAGHASNQFVNRQKQRRLGANPYIKLGSAVELPFFQAPHIDPALLTSPTKGLSRFGELLTGGHGKKLKEGISAFEAGMQALRPKMAPADLPADMPAWQRKMYEAASRHGKGIQTKMDEYTQQTLRPAREALTAEERSILKTRLATGGAGLLAGAGIAVGAKRKKKKKDEEKKQVAAQ